MTRPPARLVVLASGGGRTLENLAERIEAGELAARIVLALLSRAGIGALEHAERLGIPWKVIGKSTHPGRKEREEALLEALSDARPDWVILAGWLQLLPIPPELEGRVINIHPALLPAFGGRGFYGRRVHEAVAATRPLLSGCTVHFASGEYDRGPILLQEAVPLAGTEDAAELAAKVFEAEKRALPEALGHLIAGRAVWRNGRVLWG